MVEILARAALGGTFVVLFALVAEAVEPKRFAGLFGGAPSVALGSLSIGLIVDPPRLLGAEGVTMIAGAVGFVAFCAVAKRLLGRVHPLWAAVGGLGAWIAVSGVLYGLGALG